MNLGSFEVNHLWIPLLVSEKKKEQIFLQLFSCVFNVSTMLLIQQELFLIAKAIYLIADYI